MPKLPAISRVADIRLGKDPHIEAWLYHFLTENNLEYMLNPSIVSSPEQLRFMVALEDDQVYLPCSDNLFASLYNKSSVNVTLGREYQDAWLFVVRLVRTYPMTRLERQRILSICRYRFQSYLLSQVILPSRMAKRLVSIVLTQCGDKDPFGQKKQLANAKASQLLQSDEVNQFLEKSPVLDTANLTISRLQWELVMIKMLRLLVLSTLPAAWKLMSLDLENVAQEVKALDGESEQLRDLLRPNGRRDRKKILFIPDVAGGVVFDIKFIRLLLLLRYQVVLAVKDTFYFNSPTIEDIEKDPILEEMLSDAYVLHHDHVQKNELLHYLREHDFVILSDGTSEQLNLFRVNVSFARAWKECDIVIAKGKRNMEVLLGSSCEFTRDIFCYWRDEDGHMHMKVKPRSVSSHKFAENDLLAKAKEIIISMQRARDEGKTVMFYSAIIGSIPGQTKVAIQVVNAFVAHLRDRLENTFIINPAEHFVEGMDGDDLMYMWEHVQRSGLLDVWRFQTVEDIETSFSLLGRKIPSVWSGKDSTYSTGCTKEMRIALDVQHLTPELQIIGPSSEKFFRRKDYGVGKYFDATLQG